MGWVLDAHTVVRCLAVHEVARDNTTILDRLSIVEPSYFVIANQPVRGPKRFGAEGVSTGLGIGGHAQGNLLADRVKV